jgi:hypothetical protein
MRKTVGFLTFAVLLLAGPAVFGQATRTWVSGVGDDANPCSRTAPCKTFAGAISKTAAGGEISVLDPGGFGAVNITKSITLNGAGTLASILFSGTNGVIVNGAGIIVTLKDISLNGGTPTSPGVNGIRIIQAAVVNVINCDIFNFSNAGIRDERSTAGVLNVRNTTIHDSILFGGNTVTSGIHSAASAGTPLTVTTVEFCSIYNIDQTSSAGLRVRTGGVAIVSDTTLTNSERGVFADGGTVNLTRCQVSNNTRGIRSSAGSLVRMSDVLVTGNLTQGLEFSGGPIESFGNNRIIGNGGNNGAGITPVAEQ